MDCVCGKAIKLIMNEAEAAELLDDLRFSNDKLRGLKLTQSTTAHNILLYLEQLLKREKP